MTDGPWLWVALGVLTFVFGFMLSWWQMRRRLQTRVNEVVAEEVARRIQQRVLDELGGRRPGEPTQQRQDAGHDADKR